MELTLFKHACTELHDRDTQKKAKTPMTFILILTALFTKPLAP